MTITEYKEKKEALNIRIRNLLTFLGWILTGLFSVVYIIAVVIIIYGFEVDIEPNDMFLLSALGAGFTFAISMSMMYQGILYAKSNPEVKEVLDKYNAVKFKHIKKIKKIRTINSYIFKQFFINLFTKAGVVALLTYTMIKFIIKGIGDVMILWLGVANILLAVGLGMLSLVSAYDRYIEDHIPAIAEKTAKLTKPAEVNISQEKEADNAKN